ncbi:MAG: hypothetical protein ABIL58_19950 [Pseudomonadota bacterium]
MSGTFPTTPAPSKVSIESFYPTFVSTAHNQSRQVSQRGGHRWFLTLDFPKGLTRAELAPIFAFLVAQRGQYDTFTYTPPVVDDPRGSVSGTPLVDGASQTGRTIATKGWTASQTGIVLAGDFIRFAGHNKVYMITANADSDGSGEADISIDPALLASPVNEAVITVTDVPFTVGLLDDRSGFALDGPTFEFTKAIQFIERPE